MKDLLEKSIEEHGLKGKESLIRSSAFINMIHEAVKQDLIDNGVDPLHLMPPKNMTKPEMRIAGFLKRKDQDVCTTPVDIHPSRRKITWGPEAVENKYDEYGDEFTRKTLVINVRSQMSSLAKNTDTLFERTFAEPMNLHMIYNDLVLGEVYLIPVFEYEQGTMTENQVTFVNHKTNIEKYIAFFDAVSGRNDISAELYKYERCALLIVDFRSKTPKMYHNTKELIDDDLLPEKYPIEYANISYDNFIESLLKIYDNRFGLDHLTKSKPYF